MMFSEGWLAAAHETNPNTLVKMAKGATEHVKYALATNNYSPLELLLVFLALEPNNTHLTAQVLQKLKHVLSMPHEHFVRYVQYQFEYGSTDAVIDSLKLLKKMKPKGAKNVRRTKSKGI